jgi:hypothetical protein
MSDIHPQAEVETRPLVRFGRFLKDNPVIPLIGLLFLLIGVLEIMRPGIISPSGPATRSSSPSRLQCLPPARC